MRVNNKMDKKTIGILLILIGFIGLIIIGIIKTVYRFEHPDQTDIRVFIDTWNNGPSIVGYVSFLVMLVGLFIYDRDDN